MLDVCLKRAALAAAMCARVQVFTKQPLLLALGMFLQYTVLPAIGYCISRCAPICPIPYLARRPACLRLHATAAPAR